MLAMTENGSRHLVWNFLTNLLQESDPFLAGIPQSGASRLTRHILSISFSSVSCYPSQQSFHPSGWGLDKATTHLEKAMLTIPIPAACRRLAH